MGSSFEAIQSIIERLDTHEKRLGVCFDTSHGFAAGYDLRTEKAVKTTIKEFDEIIGLHKLKLIHVNDAIGDFNSRTDRHEHIGLGYIGEAGFRALLHQKKLSQLPLILETPIDERRDDVGNIRKLRELANRAMT